jgi:hypothetical protein
MNRDDYFDQLEVKVIEVPKQELVVPKKVTRLPDTEQDVILVCYENGKKVSEEVVKVARTNIEYE